MSTFWHRGARIEVKEFVGELKVLAGPEPSAQNNWTVPNSYTVQGPGLVAEVRLSERRLGSCYARTGDRLLEAAQALVDRYYARTN